MECHPVPLSKEQQDTCFAEIEYSREQLSEDVQTIREWLNRQDHLPTSMRKEVHDSYIENFLMGCKGSLEKTKFKMDALFSLKSTDCVLVRNMDPFNSELMKAQTFVHNGILPKPLPNGTRIACTKIHPENYQGDLAWPLKAGIMKFEYYLREGKSFCANKWMFVINVEGITPEILSGLSFNLIQDALHILLNVLPFRTERIVFINCPSFMEFTTNYIIKPLLTKKLQNRFSVTSEGAEFLQREIPNDILPKDYGGDGPLLSDIHNHFVEAIQAISHLVTTEWSERTEESKRPLDLKNSCADTHFGQYGSIKKLSVD